MKGTRPKDTWIHVDPQGRSGLGGGVKAHSNTHRLRMLTLGTQKDTIFPTECHLKFKEGSSG